MKQEFYQIELENTKFTADRCDGQVKDCKLFATNCVIRGKGNVLQDEIKTERDGLVFCSECGFYSGLECKHDGNTKHITTYLRRVATFTYQPSKINFDNQCVWYEKRQGCGHNTHKGGYEYLGCYGKI